MYSPIDRSNEAAISKNDPLVLILRKCLALWEERELSHAQWVKDHKWEVRAVGRLLQFLDLAEPDELSAIGWKAKAQFFELGKIAALAKGAAPENYDFDDREINYDDEDENYSESEERYDDITKAVFNGVFGELTEYTQIMCTM